MRKLPMKILLSVAILPIILLGGCNKPEQVLHLYNWADYVKPELVTRFEKENHCKVVLDTYDSNENMYARLKAGATGYDLAFPSSYMVQIMREQNMLERLDHHLLPNLSHLDPTSLKVSLDPDVTVAVPYTVSYTGVAYLKSRVKDVVNSWAMFDRADLAGRMTMLNDMRETIAAGLRFLGYSSNTTDEQQLAAARDVLIRWKKNLAKFENEQYKPGLASGEFLLVHGYVGDLLQIQAENPDIGIFFPKEGFVTTCDCMVIPKGARNIDLAHKYINFMLDPQVAAENTGFTQYLCPNKDSYALLDKAAQENPAIILPSEVKALGEVNLDLGENNAKYVKIWDEIKSAP
ncbi:MAG: spermidine/putrescine ABC transporter substrate-binding protein [Lentisphaerota bacterium]